MTSTSTYPVIKGTLVSTENYTWNTADSLGRGASAMVFLGRHKTRGSYVAVKVFHEHVHASYKADDLRELELLKQLKHPNIIQWLAIEKMISNMKTVLVMEYCEGGSLHHMLDQPPYYHGLTEDEYLLVLFHVCDGMKYLQEKNVIHRDIKPGNIMRSITEDGFSVYKLTDFGAARNLHEDESFQSLYGTEEYLHPGMYERAVLKLPNSQSFDAKVDLWSLGVTFFHTATGQLPFQPYGGRNNKNTMFEIITQKESGVISGVQSFENGPIHWKRDLPESSPLSSGLKSIVIPLLAGLMEPDASKMITYQSLFRMVHNIKQKIAIHVFHYNKCEDLRIYADPNITFTGLQDHIAALTDIVASDQILIVGGKILEEVIDPTCALQNYPSHLLTGSIYLFQREMTETHKIPKPEIPAFPEFMPYSDMDADARIAHNCSARGELIKRNLEKVSQQQERLVNGLFYLRVYVENRLAATKVNHESLKQQMSECKVHITTFFEMVKLVKDFMPAEKNAAKDFAVLNEVLKDAVIRQVHDKANERMTEIEQYRDMLIKKLEDIKNYASKFTAGCVEEKCLKKIQHHLSIISGVHSRFKRDKSVKNQMTPHDENIHGFERQKLQEHCVTMRSIFTDHCLPQLDIVYKNSIHICESLTKCLTRVAKIEKNIASVLNCQNLLSEKLLKYRKSCTNDLQSYIRDSGFHSVSPENIAVKTNSFEAGETGASTSRASSSEAKSLGSGDNLMGGVETKPEGAMSMSENAERLKKKLESVIDILDDNYSIIRSLDEIPLQSTGSLSQRLHILSELGQDNT